MKKLKITLVILLIINIIMFIYLLFSKGIKIPTEQEYLNSILSQNVSNTEVNI